MIRSHYGLQIGKAVTMCYRVQFRFVSRRHLDKWWKLWVENLECIMDFEGIEAGKKKAALLAVGGPKLWEPFNTLDNVGETYDTTKAAITVHFVGTKNLMAE